MNLKLSEAINQREELYKLAKDIKNWHIHQKHDRDSQMPKCIELELAIDDVVGNLMKEYHSLNKKINSVIEGIEIEID